jgi:hypothetical protein
MAYMTYKNRRDTAANWTAINPTLNEGEIGFELDTYAIKVGDGVTAWVDLDYFADGGGGGVTDHGALTGLADDDHTQYHNDARGDVRYAPLARGVTNGDSHDHVGGDGAQIAYSGLSGLPDLSSLHTRSHAVTGVADHTAGNWKVFYSNGSGEIVELPLGAADEVLTSSGASSAPTFAAVAGGSAVNKVSQDSWTLPVGAVGSKSYIPGQVGRTSTPVTVTVTADRAYYIPFHVAETVYVLDIAIRVTAAVGGSSAEVAIYDSTGTNSGPGARLIYESLSTASTGRKITSGFTEELTPGLYWAAISCTVNRVQTEMMYSEDASQTSTTRDGVAQYNESTTLDDPAVDPSLVGSFSFPALTVYISP